MQFTYEELKKVDTIRKITKGNIKDLGELLNEGKGKIPIFGYPLICYSPNQTQEELLQELLNKNKGSQPNQESLWTHLHKSINSSLKEGHQLLIKDLLDSHDDRQEEFEELLRKFATGKSFTDHDIH